MKIINEARTDFQYRLSPDSPIISQTIFSNKVYTTIVPITLTVEKYVNKSMASVYDILTYTIIITNITDKIVTNVFFEDDLPPTTQLISNSITINNNTLYCEDLTTPIYLGSILPNGKVIITFKVLLLSFSSNKQVSNYSIVSFDYIFNIIKPPISFSIRSNTVTTFVENILFKQFNHLSNIDLPSTFNYYYSIKKINSSIEILETKFSKALLTRTNKHPDNTLCNLIILCRVNYEIIYSNKYQQQLLYKEYFTEGLSTFIPIPWGATLTTIKSINLKFESTSFCLIKSKLLINSNLILNIY